MTFTYRDNRHFGVVGFVLLESGRMSKCMTWQTSPVLAEVEAEGILEADAAFEAMTQEKAKSPFIGVALVPFALPPLLP